MNSRTKEIAIFCMNYDKKYYGHVFLTPRKCNLSSMHENWYSQK